MGLKSSNLQVNNLRYFEEVFTTTMAMQWREIIRRCTTRIIHVHEHVYETLRTYQIEVS